MSGVSMVKYRGVIMIVVSVDMFVIKIDKAVFVLDKCIVKLDIFFFG